MTRNAQRFRHVPDDRVEAAHRLHPIPTDRPATRGEIWRHYHTIYFDRKAHKKTPMCDEACLHSDAGELERFCRDAWVWSYAQRFIYTIRPDGSSREWDKHPDWTEGDPVVPEAVPEPGTIPPQPWNKTVEWVTHLFKTANHQLKEAA